MHLLVPSDNQPAAATAATQRQSVAPAEALGSRRPGIVQQREQQAAISASPRQLARQQAAAPLAARPNRTGLPAQLKAGVESLSGHSLDDVQVHYNSAQPAQLQALAYAQGTDIHVAPGQEQHLPHEAWHVVQQKQGRVQPTIQAKGVAVNDDAGLEREADVMGAQAMLAAPAAASAVSAVQPLQRVAAPVVQRAGVFTVNNIDYDPVNQRFAHQVINTPTFVATLKGLVASSILAMVPTMKGAAQERAQAQLRTRITSDVSKAATWPDIAAPDVQALAAAITANLLNDLADKQAPDAAEVHAAVTTALVHALPSAASGGSAPEADRSGLSEKEIGLFDGLLAAATSKSRSKGTASSVALGDLGAVGEVQGAVEEAVGMIQARNRKMLAALLTNYTLFEPGELGAEAGFGMGIRSMHTNAAGWLPPSPVALPVTLADLKLDIDTRYAAIDTGPRQAALNTLSADAQAKARASIRKTAISQALAACSERDRIKLIWGSYAENQGPLMNYVELNLGSPISRIMYDFVSSRFFITAHYNWFRGYNPFFEVTGLTDR